MDDLHILLMMEAEGVEDVAINVVLTARRDEPEKLEITEDNEPADRQAFDAWWKQLRRAERPVQAVFVRMGEDFVVLPPVQGGKVFYAELADDPDRLFKREAYRVPWPHEMPMALDYRGTEG